MMAFKRQWNITPAVSRRGYVVLLGIVMLATASAYTQIARAQSPLEADAAAFRYDSTHAQVEIYYGVLQRALAFHGSGNHYVAYVAGKAEVWQGGKATVSSNIRDTMRFDGTKEQLDSLGANKLLAIAGFSVPYATGTTAAFIWQRGSEAAKSGFDTILVALTLPDHDPAHMALSGIELASSADKLTGKTSPFEKAGFNLTPNPSSIFGENYTKLYYYTELYIPQNLVGSGEPAEIVTRVLDPAGKQVLASSQKVPLSGAMIPLITALDIDGLPEDSYKLDVQLKHEDAIQAEVEKPFFFSSGMKLSEEAPPPVQNSDDVLFATSDMSKLSEAEADERIAQSLYIASDEDKKTAKKLGTLAEKQHFLFGYWRKKDVEMHSSRPLQAYDQHMDRVAQANKLYVYQKTPGWKTSRGRIFIVFGPPQYFSTHDFSAESKPYIQWEYDPKPSIRINSGTRPQFIFLDRQGGGNYFLVHSNVQGETSEPDWYTREALRLSH